MTKFIFWPQQVYSQQWRLFGALIGVKERESWSNLACLRKGLLEEVTFEVDLKEGIEVAKEERMGEQG